MLDASTVFYMQKLVAGPDLVGVVDIRLPIGENLRAIAKARGQGRVGASGRAFSIGRGTRISLATSGPPAPAPRLLLDGDVAGGIDAASMDGLFDICVGTGGSPEGVATACAIKALGGVIQTILAPQSDDERQRGLDAGLKFDHVYEADELVKSDNTFFVATGVTDGNLVSGVRRRGHIIRTESIVLRSHSGTIRRVIADHLAERWLDD